MKKIVIISMMMLFPAAGFAQSALPSEGPSLNRKVRNLGMGNVGVGIRGTADSAPFYNPAGLNDVEKGRFQFFTITGDISAGAVGFFQDFLDFKDKQNKAQGDSAKIDELDKFINDHTSRFEHVRFALDIINYARKNFAAGLVIDQRLDASFRDPAFPHFDVRNLADAAVYVSGSHDFWDKLLQVGVTLRPTVRLSFDEADQQITFADVVGKDVNGKSPLENQVKKIKQRRFGVGADVGAKSNLGFPIIKSLPGYDFLKPSVGVTWQDIGSPDFGAAPDNPQSLSAGVAVHPDFGIFKNTVGLDIRDLNRDKDFLNRFHFGIESMIDWALSVALRAGINQGYVTGGITLDLWAVKLDGAIYYEEVGVKTSQKSDLRFATTLSFNI